MKKKLKFVSMVGVVTGVLAGSAPVTDGGHWVDDSAGQ